MAQPNIVQSSPHRVYIQNLAFNASKQAILNVIETSTGLQVPLQVIRKPQGHSGMWCSGIFAVPTHGEIQRCVSILNNIHPSLISAILAPGSTSLRAREAYHPGARSIGNHIRAPHLFQPSTSSTLPFYFPQQTGQLSSNQVQSHVPY